MYDDEPDWGEDDTPLYFERIQSVNYPYTTSAENSPVDNLQLFL